MDARFVRVTFALFLLASLGASYRTNNFLIEAPTTELAKEIGDAAEVYRHDLAVEWLGKAMPNWSRPCPITAKVEPQLGAGGATTFVFEHGEVFGWEMKIQGSRERVLDSVLPHEVTHTIFASHFRRPLPRWADEGACTTVEHVSEKAKQHKLLITFLQTGRGIAFNQLFAMKEYPKDVLPLYSQGYSLARYLIEQGGQRQFVAFVGEGLKNENWPSSVRKYYGYADLSELQTEWLAWVKQGSPAMTPKDRPALLASNENALAAPTSGPREPGINFRAQSEDRPLAAPAGDRQMLPVNMPSQPLTGAPSGVAAGHESRASAGNRYAPGSTGSAPPNDPPVPAGGGGSRYLRSGPGPNDSAAAAPTARQVMFEWSRTGSSE